ncbi:MAG: ATP-binding protein [Deltaproteobacteria bacterium]|jgi:DNA replication protein DnaC|nr:ATP-binding protein [Deltaproteobacteria bacterium]
MEANDSIAGMAQSLRLPIFGSYAEYVRPGMSIGEALAELMSQECARRSDALARRRIRDAGLPNGKTIDTFRLAPSIPHLRGEQVDALATCEFINNHMNVCALGGSGTGKTHLMAAVSRVAVQSGRTVKFMRVSDMLTMLHEAGTEKRLGAAMKALLKVDLLSLDELGYISLNAKKAQLLFDVVAKRSEAGSSIFVTSNYEFSKWKDFIGDPVLTKALVGKLAGDAIILNMNGEDYRLASRRG